MIFSEILYAFRNDLEIEYVKRRITETEKFQLVDKQLKLIFSKVVSDLQKEFKIIISSQTIAAVVDEHSYALTRDFMTLHSAYYDGVKLKLVTKDKLYNLADSSGTPIYFAISQVGGYPYLLVNPAPNDNTKNFTVKSYNDMQLYSVNDGIDSKSAGTDVQYLNTPTQYDAAILLGMMAELFDDKTAKYEREKLRLKSLRLVEGSISYDMTGVNDEFPKTDSSYNSDIDGTPSVVPSDPVII